jgi:hypothetical protein
VPVYNWVSGYPKNKDGVLKSGRTYALVVDDFDDGCQSTVERTLGKENDAADFDESPCRRFYLGFAHCD